MIDDSEVLAGIAFLTRYARPELRQALEFCAAACREVMARDATARLRMRPADDLELSIRSLHGLQSLGLETVGAVEKFFSRPDEVILKETTARPYYLGKKSMKEIREVLKTIGLDWRG